MKTDIFYITTGMGSTQQWAEIAELAVHAVNLNNIGYSGKFNSEKMGYQEYFNCFVNTDKINFAINQTKYDNGDFSERYTLTRTIVEKPNRHTVEQLRKAHQALMDEAAANICEILDEKGILRIKPNDYIAYEYNLGKEDNRNIIEVWSDGTVIVPEDWDFDEDADELEEGDIETEEGAMLDLEPEELYNLLECVEKGNYEILELK
jgi:hypothetical protein